MGGSQALNWWLPSIRIINDYTTAEKNKLAGIAAGAQANQHAFSNIKVGSSTVAADSVTDTLELEAGSNVTLTPDTANDKVRIAAKDTTYADFVGATFTKAGEGGLVPAPSSAARGKVLLGKGSWDDIVISTSYESDRCVFHMYFGSDADSPEARVHIDAASSSRPGVMLPAEKQKLAAFQDASKYALKTDIAGMYKYKGSVADASKLPTTNRTVGDVYNIETAGQYGGAGMNVAWDGTKWDPLGDIFNVTAITNTEIDNICV